jgi:TonB family protein
MRLQVFSYIVFISISTLAQEGLVKAYYPNDTLKSEINYVRNVRDGDAIFYYNNGKIKEELTYVNGKVDGVVKQYDEKGILKELFTLEDGKRNGPTSYFNSDGTWLADKDFENGKRAAEDNQPQIGNKQEQIASLSDEKKTKITNEKNNIKKTEDMSLPPTIEEKNYDDDPAYYLSAEVMPEPKNGIEALESKIKYPEYAQKHGIQGTVKIRAFIDQNGDVTNAEVVEGIGYGCDEMAKITVMYTKFSPGLIRGKPVKTQIVIPLEFKPAH